MSRDDVYLVDMLLTARRIQRRCEGHTFESFQANIDLVDATVRRIQVIGEAARRVSETTRQKAPDIPRPQIVGMRHRVVHDYTNVDLEQVWEVVGRDIPNLIARLEAVLPREDYGA